MAAADMATWRRQNSDTHPVEILLVDGSLVRGGLLISRDMSLRQFMNLGAEAYVDFDCKREGPIVLAKSAIRRILPEGQQKKDDQLKIDALAARRAELERNDPYKMLGVPQTVDAESLRKAYIAHARTYHPDRFADAGLPAEVMEYMNAMTRRINGAYEDIGAALEAAEKAAAFAAEAQAQAQAKRSPSPGRKF